MIRKCNYPNCRKQAKIIIPFNSIGATDAYCKEHWDLKEKLKKSMETTK
jgi:hypothetical protein